MLYAKTIFLFSCVILFACNQPSNVVVDYYQQAQQAYSAKNYEDASAAIDSAIKIDPTSFDYQLLKAQIKLKQDLYFEPLIIYDGCKKSGYPKEEMHLLYGNYYYLFGNYLSEIDTTEDIINLAYNNAFSYCDSALKLNPKCLDAYIITSRLFHDLGAYDPAFSVLDSALGIFPDDRTLLYLSGVELKMMGDSVLGTSMMERAIETGEVNEEFLE